MNARKSELFVVWVMRILAVSFLVVGISFIADPNGTITRIADAGSMFGTFADAPPTDQKLWLGLAFAYMMVIAAISFVVQLDVARYRPLILILFIAKASSSLAALAFYLWDQNVFVYITNFVVDGALAILALICWKAAGNVSGSRAGGGVAAAG
jgi:hypothetical protein